MKFKMLLLTLLVSVGLVATGCTPSEPAPAPEAPAVEEPAAEEEPEAVTGASTFTDEESLMTAMGENGSWIIIFTEDFTTDQELVLEGEYTNRDAVTRKIALYDQDADRNKTELYTLTAPKLTIKSENAKLVGGTFVGDIYVEANGFLVDDSVVEGNIHFMSEEYQESFEIANGGQVTGEMEVH